MTKNVNALDRAYSLYCKTEPTAKEVEALGRFLLKQVTRSPSFLADLCLAYPSVSLKRLKLALKVGKGEMYAMMAIHQGVRSFAHASKCPLSVQKRLFEEGVRVWTPRGIVTKSLFDLTRAENTIIFSGNNYRKPDAQRIYRNKVRQDANLRHAKGWTVRDKKLRVRHNHALSGADLVEVITKTDILSSAEVAELKAALFHTGPQHFYCGLCRQGFANSASYRKHVESKHPGLQDALLGASSSRSRKAAMAV